MDFTFFIENWNPCTIKKRERQERLSEKAIENILSLRLIFHLPLRQTEGFLSSIFQLMKLNLSVPYHTTLYQRGRTIRPKVNCRLLTQNPWHIIVENFWCLKQHIRILILIVLLNLNLVE